MVRCRTAFAKAASEYGKTDLERAKSVLEEEERLLGKRKEPEVAEKDLVPPEVAENVRALRAHRPRYVQGVAGLDASLDDMVKASARRDAKSYRASVAAAISAAEQGPTTNRGETNSREDILAVLRAMQEGRWDLRTLAIHRADHRSEKGQRPELVGLPGVTYRTANQK